MLMLRHDVPTVVRATQPGFLPLQVMRLGEPRAGDEAAVTALAFSPLGNLLLAGHADGDVAFWELKRAGWECAKTVKGARPAHSPIPATRAHQDVCFQRLHTAGFAHDPCRNGLDTHCLLLLKSCGTLNNIVFGRRRARDGGGGVLLPGVRRRECRRRGRRRRPGARGGAHGGLARTSAASQRGRLPEPDLAAGRWGTHIMGAWNLAQDFRGRRVGLAGMGGCMADAPFPEKCKVLKVTLGWPLSA